MNTPDLMIRLAYRVEQDHLPGDGGYWRSWSATEYATRADALAAKVRIIGISGLPADRFRVVRLTMEVVG